MMLHRRTVVRDPRQGIAEGLQVLAVAHAAPMSEVRLKTRPRVPGECR